MTNNLDEVNGPVFWPQDEGYDEERHGFQAGIAHRPAVIVGALDAGDVRRAVRYAVDRDLPVGVQATGHGIGAAASNGVLISTKRMTDVRVDPDARTAWFAAGVTSGQLVRAVADHGLAAATGSALTVGAVGYVLGGGIGPLGRKYGYAADQVRSIDVVTAAGDAVHVTAESDPDLFWALRGGRDNFGVVTGLEIDLSPVERMFGGTLFFDTDLTDDVLRTWCQWSATVPDEMATALAVIPYPDVPGVPEPLRGKRIASIRIGYLGPAAAGEELIAPLRDIGPRVTEQTGELAYRDYHTIYRDPEQPHPFYGSNAMLHHLDPAVLTEAAKLTGEAPAMAILQAHRLGGAFGRPPAAPNAIGHRDAEYSVNWVLVATLSELDTVRPTHARLTELFGSTTSGQFPNYNFVYGDDATEAHNATAFDPADYQRLRRLKASYDPGNRFRLNRNISPAR